MKPRKVEYDVIKQLWADSQRNLTGLTKAELAPRLGLSIRTVRNVLNGYYDNKPKGRYKEPASRKETPKAGLMFFPFG